MIWPAADSAGSPAAGGELPESDERPAPGPDRADFEAARCPTVSRQVSHWETWTCTPDARSGFSSPNANAAMVSAGGHWAAALDIVVDLAPACGVHDSLVNMTGEAGLSTDIVKGAF